MKRQCTARSKASGERCKLTPAPGALVCRRHGGAAPQVQAKAAERVVEQEARTLLARMDVDDVEDPLGALRRLAGQVLAWQQVCAGLVNKLSEESVRYGGGEMGEQLRAEVSLFERAMDRCGHLLVAIAKLRIDERLAVISERQADFVVRAVDAALTSAGVTGDAAVAARRVAARELRSVG